MKFEFKYYKLFCLLLGIKPSHATSLFLFKESCSLFLRAKRYIDIIPVEFLKSSDTVSR